MPRPLETSAMPAKPQPIARPKPTVARFLLDGPVLPLVTDTLRVAEAFRNAVMGHFRRWCRRNPALAEPFRRTDQPGRFSSPPSPAKTGTARSAKTTITPTTCRPPTRTTDAG